MIGIKLDEIQQFLKTEEGTSISLQYDSPLFFTPDKLSPGSFSWPFDTPLNPNKALLKNPHVVENNKTFGSQNASIYFKDNLLRTGKLNVTDIKSKVTTYFTFGLNNISESFKNQSLREVCSENVTISNSSIVKRVHTNASQVNIVANGVGFGSSGWFFRYPNPNGLGGYIESYPSQPTDGYVPFNERVDTNSPGNTIVGQHWIVYMVKFVWGADEIGFPKIVPQPCPDPNIELNVEIINQEVGTYILQPELTNYNDQFQNFLAPIISNGSLPTTSPKKYLRFPLIASSVPVDSKTTSFINATSFNGIIQNNVIASGYAQGIARHVNRNSLQPFVTLRFALDKIASYFSFSYEGDFWSDPLLDELLIWNTTTLDLLLPFINNQKFLFWRRSFNMNELVPDISVVDFLKFLQQSFNLAVYYNEVTKNVRLQKRETIARSLNYVDITNKCSKPEAVVPVTFDANDKVIKYLSSLPTSYSFSDSVTDTIRSFNFKQGDKFEFQLIRYTGVRTVSGFYYHNVSEYSFPISSTWNFMQSRMKSVRLKVDFDFADITKIDWELKRRFDRVDYLIKKISFRITDEKIKIEEVEIYSMR